MKRKELLTIMLLCLGIAGSAAADVVISIDINNYDPNAPAFAGEAAIPGVTQWIAYSGGWGLPMGSPRTANLTSYGTVKASTYAAQVWIADPGGHAYIGSGDTLLGDGFLNTGVDPNFASIYFLGQEFLGALGGNHAYNGTFDIYVYGNSEGDFILSENGGSKNTTKHVYGTISGFVEGDNYVIFPGVSIAEPNSVRLYYTNELNGIQLVRRKTPTAISNGTVINAPDYDVAFDTNNRGGETSLYGPDVNEDQVFYLDTNEFMEYDITVSAANAGRYRLRAIVNTANGNIRLDIYLDDLPKSLGSLEAASGTQTNTIFINLFEGSHTLKWVAPGLYGGNVDDLTFTYVDKNTCSAVLNYGLRLSGDLTADCRVNLADLAEWVKDWANCYNPEPGACD